MSVASRAAGMAWHSGGSAMSQSGNGAWLQDSGILAAHLRKLLQADYDDLKRKLGHSNAFKRNQTSIHQCARHLLASAAAPIIY